MTVSLSEKNPEAWRNDLSLLAINTEGRVKTQPRANFYHPSLKLTSCSTNKPSRGSTGSPKYDQNKKIKQVGAHSINQFSSSSLPFSSSRCPLLGPRPLFISTLRAGYLGSCFVILLKRQVVQGSSKGVPTASASSSLFFLPALSVPLPLAF